jgi:CBS-domain-containing membrane protein
MRQEGRTTMHLKEIMRHPVVTCPADSTLDVAARLMWEHDCGTVPVVGSDGRLAGIITDRDICMAAYRQNRALPQILLMDVMSKPVFACRAEDTVESVEALMRDNHVRRVPIIDREARPIGVVALDDLARLADRAKRSGVDRELVETLAAIARPRPGLSEPAPRPATSLRTTVV